MLPKGPMNHLVERIYYMLAPINLGCLYPATNKVYKAKINSQSEEKVSMSLNL